MSAPQHKIDLLPENAKVRFGKIIDEREIAFEQSRKIQTEITKLRQHASNIENLLTNALIISNLAVANNGQSLKDQIKEIGERLPAPQRKQWNELKRLGTRISELNNKRHDLGDKNENFLAMTSKVIEYVEDLDDNISLKDFEFTNSTKKLILKTTSKKVDDLASEASRIQAAPFPAKEAISATVEKLEQLAVIGRPRISNSIATGAAVDVFNLPTASGFTEIELQAAPFIWLHKEALIDKISKEIQEAADDDNSIPSENRTELMQKANKELLNAERDEISAHDSEIGNFRYRENISVAAILVIEEVL